MNKGLITIIFLIISNSLMTFAWYGNLKFGTPKVFASWGLLGIIVTSWLIAFVEYCFVIPANRIGFAGSGGPFTLMQLKIIQEVISLTVFTLFAVLVFRNQTLRWNHLAAALCLIGAVYFVFKK